MYDLGDTVLLTFNAADPTTGAPVTPATVSLTVVLPDGTLAHPGTATTQAGVYTALYPTVQAGRHTVSWQTTAPAVGYTDVFDVTVTATDNVISLADAKQTLNITTTAHDDELRGFLAAVTAVLEDRTGRQLTMGSVTEQVRTVSGVAVLSEAPVQALTSAVSFDGAVTWNVSTDLQFTSEGVVGTQINVPPLYGYVVFTYVAGYSTVPGNYLLAARLLLQHLWDTKRGSGGGGPAFAIEDTPVPGTAFAVPNRVLQLIGVPRGGIA